MPFLAIKATVCMTIFIIKLFPIFHISGEAGMMKLGSHSNQLRGQGIPPKKRNSDPIQK
jgi:hypothetical protein